MLTQHASRIVPFAGSLVVACVAASVFAAAPARADGRYPDATQLVVMPGRPSTLAARTTFGVLLSNDAGASWQWICGKAIGYGGLTEDPTLAMTAGGSLLVATFDGLSASADRSCGWSHASGPLDGQVVIDVVVRPDNPHVALALTSTYAGGSAGQNLYDSRIAITTDDGAHWAPYGVAIDPTVLTSTLRVVPNDPHRVYVSGVRDRGSVRSAVLLMSPDDGLAWNEYAVPLRAGVERLGMLDAVDPNRPQRLYVRTGLSPLTPQSPPETAPSRLLVSDDGGDTFRVAFEAKGPLLGVTLSPDGNRVFVGGWQDGLFSARTDDLVFSQIAQRPVQCLTADATGLYACFHGEDGVVIGKSTDGGATFSSLLGSFCDVRGPVACSAQTSGGACSASWASLRTNQLGCPQSDLGAPLGNAADAGTTPNSTTDTASIPMATKTTSAGCSQSASSSSSCGGALLACALGAVAGRRRRRR